MLFQNYALFPHMTIAENIAYPLKLRKVPKDEVEKRVREMIEMVKLTKKYSLTARETEVLELILENYDNSEIVRRLCISPNTLKKHLQNLYRKTNVAGRIQLSALMYTSIEESNP